MPCHDVRTAHGASKQRRGPFILPSAITTIRDGCIKDQSGTSLTLIIQRNKHASPVSSAGSSPTITKTPKTPADEGIAFFESAIRHGEAPIRVYELPLEPDGGASKSREVQTKDKYCTATLTIFIKYIRFPPADTPYILRVSFEVGTPTSRSGISKPDFPFDGGVLIGTRL
jgi:glycogen debranching enzyme